MPALSKLFEKIIQTRIDTSNIPNSIHPLQHGFQKGKSSKHVSFILQESVNYCQERNSPLYACFLDAAKAFDKVWISGLLYKLADLGFVGNDLRLISNMFKGMKSRVFNQGILSDWIDVKQGTRQGSLLSPFFYTVFINELLFLLDKSNKGLKIGSQLYSAPTQADDIVVLSLSKKGLETLLKLVHGYSKKWRYIYNADKSAVIVFNENCRAQVRIWVLGDSDIKELDQYKHLGIVQAKYQRKMGTVDASAQALRGLLLSLTSSGVHPGGVNPISAMKLYTSMVLPKAFYGCELWNKLTNQQLNKLEVAHRFCIKRAQWLPKLTRTDMALSLIGSSSIEAYIALQKLTFLGSLIRANDTCLAKKLFLVRYFQYSLNCTKLHVGFIPDVMKILHKYSLLCYFETFLKDGQFEPKFRWKRLCKEAIWVKENECWKRRISTCSDFDRFNQIHTSITPSVLWKFALNHSKMLEECAYVVKLVTRPHIASVCSICLKPYNDDLLHYAFECSNIANLNYRKEFQDQVKSALSSDGRNFIMTMSTDVLLTAMMGGYSEMLLSSLERSEYEQFILASVRFLCKLDLYAE